MHKFSPKRNLSRAHFRETTVASVTRRAVKVRRRRWHSTNNSQERMLLSGRATVFANTVRLVVLPVTLVHAQFALVRCLSEKGKAPLSVTLAVPDLALVRAFA